MLINLKVFIQGTILIKGLKAIWKENAEVLNLKIDTPAEICLTIELQYNKIINGLMKIEERKYQQKKTTRLQTTLYFTTAMGNTKLCVTYLCLLCGGVHQ